MDFPYSYREPTLVPWTRNPRRVGIIQFREFGKLASYLRKKECLLSAFNVEKQVAVTWGIGLFNKNIGGC